MPARLILNADDFGLTPGVNRAIGELNASGVLTSATLMAGGTAFDDAIATARAHLELGVGCHIVLTDGTPISPPESIPSLIGPDGKSFRPSLVDFLKALFLGRIREEEIAHEALAQVQKLQRAGVTVTHLDSHKHTHLFPSVCRPLLQVSERAGVSAIRNPFEPSWSLALDHGSASRRLAIRMMGLLRSRFEAHPQIRDGRVRTTDGTIAISATGQLTAATLADLLRAAPMGGTYELCCHPGYNDCDLDPVATRLRDHRDAERNALLAEVPKLLKHADAPRLINYGSLGANR
jgi:predicted glycoside hydrolase/deacetylase ChbG (UPF0249 family)